jgi:transcriptional regulator with GAF, ATPase, and Fis domain
MSVEPVGALVGVSAALAWLRTVIDMAAASDVPVFITGQSGSGKELVARAIHNGGRRRDQPLVPVNCAAIPSELFESEFFGHAAGAFTGALRERRGRFRAAHGGTLLLDEITELPAALQAKLLRALDRGVVQRVGDDEERPVDVRVIVSTNRDVRRELESGRLRADLYYRLSVLRIAVPALAARRDDIPWLARYFLKCRIGEPGEQLLTQRDTNLLLDYDWPGNVRELFNVLELALLLGGGRELRVDPALDAARGMTDVDPASAPDHILSEREMHRLMRQNTVAALRRAHWRISGPGGAATLLGLKPSTLLSRVKRWGLRHEKGRETS